MFFLKKVIFKLMELGLGLRTCFSLETKDPIFVNFKLSPAEIESVKALLPPGFVLKPIRFTEDEEISSYWVSYNFYQLKYPSPKLAGIKKSRLEINTFVEDSQGRKGILVFCDSPFVSRESVKSLIGQVCDFAEWLVTKIYGCGQLIGLDYHLAERLRVSMYAKNQKVNLDLPVPEQEHKPSIQLSSDYLNYNDISFFNQGKSLDFVNVNSSFIEARFFSVPLDCKEPQYQLTMESRLFARKPDVILAHRGEIAYLVNSMNRCLTERQVNG